MGTPPASGHQPSSPEANRSVSIRHCDVVIELQMTLTNFDVFRMLCFDNGVSKQSNPAIQPYLLRISSIY
jgi:hypothetical protein